MDVQVGTAQWVGKRDRQEDCLVYGVGPDGRTLLVIADGMGGHVGGDIASKLAASVALEALLDPFETIPDALKIALDKANDAIAKYVDANPANEGMGTTLICAVVQDRQLWWSSVGDSHLYLCRDGDVKKLNADHSMMPVLQRMVSEGEITAEQAASDPKRNALRSVIMGDEIPLIDSPKRPVELKPSDNIVLCTDGVDSLNDTAALIHAIDVSESTSQAAQNIIDAVKSASKPRQDNTSAIVVGPRTRNAVATLDAIAPREIMGDPFTACKYKLFGIALLLICLTVGFAIATWHANIALDRSRDRVEALTSENLVLIDRSRHQSERSTTQFLIDPNEHFPLGSNTYRLLELSAEHLSASWTLIIKNNLMEISNKDLLSAGRTDLNQDIEEMIEAIESNEKLAALESVIPSIIDKNLRAIAGAFLLEFRALAGVNNQADLQHDQSHN